MKVKELTIPAVYHTLKEYRKIYHKEWVRLNWERVNAYNKIKMREYRERGDKKVCRACEMSLTAKSAGVFKRGFCEECSKLYI